MFPRSQPSTLLSHLKPKSQDRKAGGEGGWLPGENRGQQHGAGGGRYGPSPVLSLQLQSLCPQGPQKGAGTRATAALPPRRLPRNQRAGVSTHVRLLPSQRPGPLGCQQAVSPGERT